MPNQTAAAFAMSGSEDPLPALRQFVLFAGVGAVGTVAHYVTMAIAIIVAGAPPVASSTVGFVVGALVNYALNYKLTFRSTQAHRKTMPRFFMLAALGAAINAWLLGVLLRDFGFHLAIAQLAATGTVLLMNFAMNRAWTFRSEGR